MRFATYSPTAGPCLNPCPEPPPTNQTFSAPGCRSIRKSPLEVFSYWQTRVSTIGASRSAGNRRATYARTSSAAASRHNPRLRVGIDARSVSIERNLESARLDSPAFHKIRRPEREMSAAPQEKIAYRPAARQKNKSPAASEKSARPARREKPSPATTPHAKTKMSASNSSPPRVRTEEIDFAPPSIAGVRTSPTRYSTPLKIASSTTAATARRAISTPLAGSKIAVAIPSRLICG